VLIRCSRSAIRIHNVARMEARIRVINSTQLSRVHSLSLTVATVKFVSPLTAGVDNNLQQERAHGCPVEYGQVIQLYNPLHRKFVRVSPSRSGEAEPSNMKIELHPESSVWCSFWNFILCSRFVLEHHSVFEEYYRDSCCCGV
jgi:hypothetical protein